MKICSWCEGRGVVGFLAHGEEPRSIDVGGVKVPVIGTMIDKPCAICRGRGTLDDHETFESRMREIRADQEREVT